MRLHARGIRADAVLRECESRDRAPRNTWEKAALLFFSSEQKQRLRHADRLMRGQKRRDAPAITSHQDGGTRVGLLAQAEASIFPRDLDPEGTERRETFDNTVRDFAIAVDLIGIGMLFQERFERRQELTASSITVGRRFGTRMDEVHVELAHEDRARESGIAVEAFPRRFRERRAAFLPSDIPVVSIELFGVLLLLGALRGG